MKKLIAVCCALALLPFRLNTTTASAIGYGQGRICDAANRPVDAVRFQNEYAALDAYALNNDENRIVLTFDQGYENGYSAKILDTLKEKNVTAIFFLTGDYAKSEQALVRRMIEDGHTLGNHGMTHTAIPTLDDDALRDEVQTLHQYVLDNYGYEMQYFRPPCGEYDARSLACVQQLGYRTLFWSAAHVDWKTDRQPAPQKALADLTGMAHGGAVYLLHSVSATNAEILGTLIDNLRARGFTL